MSDQSQARTGELPPEEERELVRQARGGDPAAMDRLLGLHHDRVYRHALTLMKGNEDNAAELAQQVLVRAFRKIDTFRGESRFSTWLYRMTANLAKNMHVVSNRERARTASMDSMMDDPGDARPRQWSDEGPGPREQAAGNERVRHMQQCLAAMAPEFGEIIRLRFIEDLAYEEIAEILEVPVGTVKSRLSRARKELVERMKTIEA